MANLFNTLGIGYSGLSAAQVGINTTGHNIANAKNDGYTRQRVITAAATPLSDAPGNVGNGVSVEDIKRVFDNFVFDRFTGVSADKEYSDFEKRTLEELSSYFPEINAVGIKSDMAKFYDAWQTFADNPDNDAIKVSLAKQTETLTQNLSKTQEKIKALQLELNDQLQVNINEVNKLAEELADLNVQIDVAEAAGGYSANDLRDKRNVIERDLSRLIGVEINYGQLDANINIDSNANTTSGSYTVNVNGFNIVDGASFHPLKLSNEGNATGFYEVAYINQNGNVIPMEEEINGGKIGAILDLRGGTIDTTSGVPTDGIIQNVIAQFDALAKGLIEATNNLYAQNATQKMSSNVVDISPTSTLVNSNLSIKEGAFDLIIYDLDGKEVAKRTIEINAATVMSGSAGSNSIQAQIEASRDDNSDGNAGNDVEDFMVYNFQPSVTGELRLELSINPADAAKGYTFAIADKRQTAAFDSGSNFAGALGLGRYFDGDNASNIKLNRALEDNPTKISAGYGVSAGDNRLALDMMQQQFENYEFTVGYDSYNTTMYGMFDVTATYVGSTTNAAISKNETISTQFNAIEMEYNMVSKVSIDEELTNLIKYQTSYGAAAKVITTVDQMMQTLLGIKQ